MDSFKKVNQFRFALFALSFLGDSYLKDNIILFLP